MIALTHRREAIRFKEPFRISGYLFEAMPAVVATLTEGALSGRGEAAGVYYLNDDQANMERAIENCRALIEAGADRKSLRNILPTGGARNALDCAMWELESLKAQLPVWKLAGLEPPRALTTVFTLPAEDPAFLLDRLPQLSQAKAIKLKLAGDLAADSERVRTVRRARPEVWLGVDANQGFGSGDLDALVSMLVDSQVSLLEQPIRRGEEASLDGWRSPIPIAADESMLDLNELDTHRTRFDVVNIKLDKCGGLTEALMMVEHARALGLKVMVGNMAGSTLATAPAFLLGQLCDVVDLDGPWSLADDPLSKSLYSEGLIMVPSAVWGSA